MVRALNVLVLAAAMMLGGCFSLGGYDIDEGPYTGGPGGPPAVTGALTVSNGVQSGGMGDIRDFEGSASRHDGYYDTYGSSLRIDSEGSDWWVMSAINITGDLAGPAFAPGTHRTYTSGTYDPDTNVSVTGCSGPSYGNYTFDGPADETTIEVEDLGDGNRRLNFTTRYGSETTSGSVDYRLDSAGGSTAPGMDRGI